jgi:N-acetylglucosaminyldiphosphoundecaprenol N-acetyl-beta-D-mannosaminyltransferase
LEHFLNKSKSEVVSLVGVHITTLNAMKSRDLSQLELEKANLIFADGLSVSILMRLGGLSHFKRIATTDLIDYLLVHNFENVNLRVALIGGNEKISSSATTEWLRAREGDTVVGFLGYEMDLEKLLQELATFKPDLVLVGLGMPKELRFINENFKDLPNALYVTCGGYLRLLGKLEFRAPRLMRYLRLEWCYRLLTDPLRTFPRYSIGMSSLLSLCTIAIRDRLRK